MDDWSDWQLAKDDALSQESGSKFNPDEWVMADEKPAPKENLLESAIMAPVRLAADALVGGYNFAKKIPEYYQKAKTEVPGFINPMEIYRHPLHRAGQTLAGALEAGQGANRAFKEIPEYLANRLNLIPPEWAEKIPVAPDISPAIQNTFGEPKYPGEAMARGSARNMLNFGELGILKQLMPHLSRRGASLRLRRMNNLAEDRGLNPLNIDPSTIEDVRQFLPNTAPYRNLLDSAHSGNFRDLFSLQSDLGKQSSDYARSLFSAADRAHGRAGLEARNALLDAIHDAIQGQGHLDISGLLRSGQRDYRRFMGFRPYRNILGGAALAGGIGAAIPDNALTDLAEKVLLHRSQ